MREPAGEGLQRPQQTVAILRGLRGCEEIAYASPQAPPSPGRWGGGGGGVGGRVSLSGREEGSPHARRGGGPTRPCLSPATRVRCEPDGSAEVRRLCVRTSR